MTATATLTACRTVTPVHTDEVLLARLRAGDEVALGIAFDQHAGMVHGLARRVTGDEQLAGEVTQDVFIHLWEHPDRVDPSRGTLRTYLGVVAHRRAVDAVRSSARRRRAEGAAFDLAVVTAAFEDDVVRDDAVAWCRARLDDALDQLPDEQREAIVLAFFGSHTYQDVAVALGIPEGTAKSRIRLGLARVRALVGDDLLADG